MNFNIREFVSPRPKALQLQVREGSAVGIGQRCFDELIHTAREHRATSITIEKRKRDARYEMSLPGGKIGHGTIAEAGFTPLYEYILGKSTISKLIASTPSALLIQIVSAQGVKLRVISEEEFFERAVGRLKVEGGISDSAGDRALLADKRLWIADDDPSFLFALERVLEGMGYQVSLYSSGKGVLQALDNGAERPHLIIADCHMPDVDGLSLLAALKEQELSIPTLILTSDESESTEAELLTGGAQYVLKKSENPTLMSVKIQKALGAI